MILTIVFRHETTLDELVVPFHYYFGQLRVFGCFTLVFTVEETVFLRPSNGEGTRLISFHRHRPSRVLSTRDAAKKEPQVHVLRAPSVPPTPALYSPLLQRDATPFEPPRSRRIARKLPIIWIRTPGHQLVSSEGFVGIRKFPSISLLQDGIQFSF